LRGGAQPLAFVEDVGVPPEQLGECLHAMQEVLRRHETTASFLIHAATGQIHARPFLDLHDPRDAAKLGPLAEEIHGLVLRLGGTVSSQHATGLARTACVARQYGPLYQVFRELKAIFDPRQIFNPGKIVGPGIPPPEWPLRLGGAAARKPAEAGRQGETGAPISGSSTESQDLAAPASPPGAAPATQLRLHLVWRGGEMMAESQNCNGCGDCRTASPGKRMCPIFRVEHAEAATPRAKGNLVRHLLQEANLPLLSSDEVRTVADLCVN